MSHSHLCMCVVPLYRFSRAAFFFNIDELMSFIDSTVFKDCTSVGHL